ncbi:MAG: O-antigen ligase family protein [Vicinamibacteria bacterium]
MTTSPLELLGLLGACGSAAAALVLEDRRARIAAMAAALVIAPILVAGDVWDEPRVVDFRDSAAHVGGALVVAVAALTLLVVAFRRYPQAFPIAAFAALPLRVPIEIGGENANLLVPLYLVIAAGVIVTATGNVPGPAARERWSTRLRWVLAATLVLYAIQASYSEDVPNAIENAGFFLAPFAVLFALLAEVEWSRELLRRTLIAVAAVTAGCALVGIYQYVARDLFLNPELFDANELHVYFRVNSIFFDPNVFGRYLALGLTALAACVAWGGRRRDLGLAAAVFALGLVALAFSYSLTSCAALLAGLGTVAVLRWRWRGAALFASFGAVTLAALLIAGGTPTSDIQADRSIDSGHSDLVRGGLVLFGILEPEEPSGQIARPPNAGEEVGRPIAGYGSGSFGRAFFENIEPARTTVSHSEPITVAAEQGVIGLLVYGALLVISLVTMIGGGAGASLARTVAAACYVAILFDSFGYTGFTIDPATWALLGLGVALRASPAEPSATIDA